MFPLSSFAQDEKACEAYHEGYMEYAEKALFGDVILFRKGDIQIEYSAEDDLFLLLEIEWKSPCEYSLNLKNSNWKLTDPMLNETIEVEITNANADYYRYLTILEMEGQSIPLKGKMLALKKKKVPKKIRKKIEEIYDTKKDIREYPVKT